MASRQLLLPLAHCSQPLIQCYISADVQQSLYIVVLVVVALSLIVLLQLFLLSLPQK